MEQFINLMKLCWEILASIWNALTSPAAQSIYPFIALGMLFGLICMLVKDKFRR